MSLIDADITTAVCNPVDMIEHFAERQDWVFDRPGTDEITISVAGSYADYNLSFTYLEEVEGLHLACSFDLRIPERQRANILELLARINERLWIGHFDVWMDAGLLLLRQTVLLNQEADISENQVDALVRASVETAERYFPAFQFVLWGGKSASEALEAVMLETAGEA